MKMLMSRHQNARQNQNMRAATSSFQNMAKLQYSGLLLRYQYCIHEEIKKTLISENACYHKKQKLSSCFVSNSLEVQGDLVKERSKYKLERE
jgi:hypothetical protein